ncbi:hypothetical protein FPV67DRAFT_1754654 [Lyophyllum atratum]|nr:hypothetical protein FPV67DRAFT_1754654 [Lyophyllum atratum]
MERSTKELEREVSGMFNALAISFYSFNGCVKDVIRRAKGNPDKTGSQRRDALKRLVDLTHSPHENLKILAAQNIRYLFVDFPELEEEAINAVYDLCEDQSPRVRVEGYAAITHLSNADHKLVKRNADVLLQLLQSDEVDEVSVVKKACMEHLDMDPKVTLGVLCDQIAPLDDTTDEEEQSIRDRLRSVVLAFMTGEARRAIVERHALPGSDAEEAYITNLLTVIPKLGYSDAEIIVKELLIPLKAYKAPSPRGHILLQTILDKVAEYLQLGTRSGDASLLRSAQPYLDLANFVVVEKQAAPAIQLLRFYCSSISTKMTLQKFSKDDQALIVSRLVETLAAADTRHQTPDEGPSLEALSRQIIDSCPFLLESLRLSATSPPRFMNACAVLLRACLRRKRNTSWTPPPNLITALNKVQATVTKAQSQDVFDLIRSLVPPASTSIKLQSKPTTPDTSATPTSQSVKNNGLPASLPERPQAPYPARRMHIQSNARPQNRDQIMAGPRPSSPVPTTAKHQIAPEPSNRPPKRQKGGDDDAHVEAGPSLLSRLGTALSSTPMPRANPPGWTAAQLSHAAAVENLPLHGEWSIRGAAKLGDRNTTLQPPRQPMPTPSYSLLERLEGGSTGGENPRDEWGKRHRGRP